MINLLFIFLNPFVQINQTKVPIFDTARIGLSYNFFLVGGCIKAFEFEL